MALLRRAGRLVSQNRGVRAAGMVAVGGTAMMAGVGSAMTDPEGVYQQDIFPDAQELAFGNPRMAQESIRGGITAAMSGQDDSVLRNSNYYYSRPVNLRGNENLGIPVSGELVFGMYNMRR